ncbi:MULTISPECIES: hypothetical protein [unclassified Streptomyces]|uniref:hypothetical protein n=1 Tax=unclassified Streptomyces TaxID=2593676 RepID=UPI00224F25FB|nr:MULTISPECIES: hypothetical protein [unclassified Streptomyces]MCX4885581.1 hypothetical protein [Streptomyces sp. NBC_00847]MCX5425444.1 hypothetical protein [Streptomyces sp. NBC_00078]
MARWTAGAVLAVAVAASLTGCSDDTTPSSAVSKAASAATSLASRGSEALASATAEAGRKLDEVKGSVDAKDSVKLGPPTKDGDGRTTVPVTAHNTASSAKSFAVQVNFDDAGGNLLDTVVVTLSDVAAGKSGEATARSTHKLSGEVKAEVGTALRY